MYDHKKHIFVKDETVYIYMYDYTSHLPSSSKLNVACTTDNFSSVHVTFICFEWARNSKPARITKH